MISEGVGARQVQEIFREWRDSRRALYASIFDAGGIQTCAGRVEIVDDETAVITDTAANLRVPYASAGDCAVATLDHRTKSVTLTWRDGTSAFIVTRNLREEEQS